MMDAFREDRQAPTLGYASAAARPAPSWLADALRRWWLGPPRVWQIILLAFIFGFFAYTASFPGGSLSTVSWYSSVFGYSLVGLCAGSCLFWPGGLVLLGLDYLIRLILGMVKRQVRAKELRWYLPPLLILATSWTGNTDRLLRWRFEMNRQALNAEATRLLQSAATAPADPRNDVQWPFSAVQPTDGRVGDYDLIETAVFPNESVVYLTTGGFFRAGWGFVYDPNSVVRTTWAGLPLGGGWFAYHYAKE
jgi:hypothetical protein